MIKDLYIENIAVIEKENVSFGPGFNVMTGETGAGKSIVVDAIDAVLGGRTTRELIRTGADKAMISAVFTDVCIDDWLEKNDIEADEEIILQRRINSDGKSSCRVCGVPVTVQQLRELGSLLLDIHGQNDGRQLMDENRHLAYLDSFANRKDAVEHYSQLFLQYQEIKKEIKRLSMNEYEKERLMQQLTLEVSELEQASVHPGEEEELAARQVLMKNSEKLTETLEKAYQALYEADENAISLVSDAAYYTKAAAALAPELNDAAKSVDDARFLLTDAVERINDLRNALDFSEEEYCQIESRLAQLRRLERKYASDEAGLIQCLEVRKKQLSEIESSSDLLIQLEKDLQKKADEVLAAGKELSSIRCKAAELLQKRIETELKYLNMPSVRFVAEMVPVSESVGFNSTGCEEVRFLMSANAGENLGRISHIASGGELSRIMLAMKSVFAEHDAVGSMVFDEIDTGVSGIAAQRVGEKMASLARKRQVICITHLPQIAAMADVHFQIQKEELNGHTFTSVTELDRSGRIRELARLHGGDVVTSKTLDAAEEQLNAADAYKNRLGTHCDD